MGIAVPGNGGPHLDNPAGKKRDGLHVVKHTLGCGYDEHTLYQQ